MEYVTAGSVAGAPVDPTYGNDLGTISSDAADQPQFRYNSAGYYEVRIPGYHTDWVRWDSRGDIEFRFNTAPEKGFEYSVLTHWLDGWGTRFGYFGVGIPTEAGAVPVSGTAQYSGIINGSSDVQAADAGGAYRVPVSGSVSLGFDFGQGALSGSMQLQLGMYEPVPIGNFAFRDTVFSAGSTSYSGRFDTIAGGQNYFLGYFTGPNAEETVGTWALPFVLTNGSNEFAADGQAHQAFGAWIARRGP